MISIVFEENGFPRELTSEREITRAIASGRLSPDTLVRVLRPDGSSPWLVASKVSELRHHFGFEAENGTIEPELCAQPVPPPQNPWREEDTRPRGLSLDAGFAPSAHHSSGWDVAKRLDGSRWPDPVNRSKSPAAHEGSILSMGILPLKRYADVAGRARRKEFWSFQLLQFVWLFAVFLMTPASPGAAAGLLALSTLGLIVPNLAVGVRRLHDQNITGWLLLIAIIPWLGALVLFILACLDGTPGPNKYGADPKNRAPRRF
jgi:uncharacterized membrane protein YhaH (DUF805 family)